MEGAAHIAVDVISDVVCPWCYVGKKRLERALRSIPQIPVNVAWRPFQLDPNIPHSGYDRKAYVEAKFGSPDRVRRIHDRLAEIGRAEGISFDFEAIRISPNSLDAHRVVRWAQTSGAGVQSRLVSGLFERYFEHGEDIGDHRVLIAAANDSGMDGAVVEALLPTDADRVEVHREIETAVRMGVTGVPCFLLDGKYAVVGAQAAEILAEAIRTVAGQDPHSETAGTLL